MQIEISDPVARELYICMPHGRTCQVEVFSPPESLPYTPPAKAHMAQGSSSESVDLGKQSVGGLERSARERTTIIPAGTIGNNGPLLSKREFWFSPRLGVNLISKRQDPFKAGTAETSKFFSDNRPWVIRAQLFASAEWLQMDGESPGDLFSFGHPHPIDCPESCYRA